MAYIVIQDWMISDLQLKGNELLTYSLIYGFSQDGESEFKGSLKYISEFLGISKSTAQRSIISIHASAKEATLIKLLRTLYKIESRSQVA